MIEIIISFIFFIIIIIITAYKTFKLLSKDTINICIIMEGTIRF